MSHLNRNPNFHSISSQSTNKFRSLVNSPNFGNQQILLQSCCFFDSEKSQTPHASHTLLKDYSMRKKNICASPKISYSNGNLNSFKKFQFLEDYNDDSNDIIIDNKSDQQIISKLKKHNKALKETIKNLTSQLDRVCNIASKAKKNEMNTIQKNNDNEQEKALLLNEIENLKKEKDTLKIEFDKKEEEIKNYKLKNKINEIKNNNKLKNNEYKRKRFITDMSDEFENVKPVNNSLSISVNKEINENKKYKNTINKLSQENVLLKNRIDEQLSALSERIKEKDKNIQDLKDENFILKTNLKNLKINKNDNEEINIKEKGNEENELKKENMSLSNKLIEAGKTISEYILKYDEAIKKYNDIKNQSKQLEKEKNDLNIQLLIQKNKYEEKIKVENTKLKENNNYIQKNYDILLKEKDEINSNYNTLLNEFNITKSKLDSYLETINNLKEDNNEYISDNTLLSKKYVELKAKYEENKEENKKLKNKISNIEKVNNELIKRLEEMDTNIIENYQNDNDNKFYENKKSVNFSKNNFEELKIKYNILFNNYNQLKSELENEENEINYKNQEIYEYEQKYNDISVKICEIEEKYNKEKKENEILKNKIILSEKEIINLKKENKNINDSYNLLNNKYKKLNEEYKSDNNKILKQKSKTKIIQLNKEIKLNNENLLKKNKSENIKLEIEKETDNHSENIIKSKSSRGIVGKLKQDIFLTNQKNIELKKLLEEKEILITNYEKEIKKKDLEIVNFKKIVEDIARKPINYGQLLTAAFVLGKQFTKHSKQKEMVNALRSALDADISGLTVSHPRFAVVAPVVFSKDPHLIIEVRAGGISQAGDPCFPGGKIEAGETPAMAASREMEEELGILVPSQDFLGELPMVHTNLGHQSSVFVCEVPASLEERIRANPSEVAVLLKVPMSFFLEKPDEMSWTVEGHVIWGMTAGAIRYLCKAWKKAGMGSARFARDDSVFFLFFNEEAYPQNVYLI